MNGYTNIVDTRERDFPARLATWQVKTLPVADFWIGLSGDQILPGAILIERKTISDLEASMKDGRYREQRTRLQAFAEEHSAHVAYLIEGDLNQSKSFSKSVLWKWILRLPFIHKIPLLYTSNQEETAELLENLSSQWKENYTEFRDGKKTEYLSTIKHTHTKGEQRDDPIIFACTVLSSCKGISPQMANCILKGCGGTLESVMAASLETIAGIQSGKSKVGPAKAKKLVDLLHFKPNVATDSLPNMEE